MSSTRRRYAHKPLWKAIIIYNDSYQFSYLLDKKERLINKFPKMKPRSMTDLINKMNEKRIKSKIKAQNNKVTEIIENYLDNSGKDLNTQINEAYEDIIPQYGEEDFEIFKFDSMKLKVDNSENPKNTI